MTPAPVSSTVAGPEGLPWPSGDPDQLGVTAQQAAGLADETEGRRASLLASGRAVNPWSGVANQAYVTDLERHAAAADRMTTGLRETSSGLTGLAGVLRPAQELIRRLGTQVADAREQSVRMARRAEQARADATAAQLRMAAVAPASGGADPSMQEAHAAEDAAQAAEYDAARAQQHAADVERQCRARAEQACEDVRRQDRQSAATIGQSRDRVRPDVLFGVDVAGGMILGKMEGWAGGVRYLAKAGHVPGEWLPYAKWAGYGLKAAGGGLALVTSGIGQWLHDQGRHAGMDTDERVGRAAAQSLTVGGATVVAGMATGAVVGSAVPVVGTVLGGVIGAAVGIGAGLLADRLNDGAVDWAGNRTDRIDESSGKVLDKLTFWS